MLTTTARKPRTQWARRFGWLFLIWVASVATLGVLAFALRGLMGLAGMHA